MGRPCKCCKKNFNFIIILFIDESSIYTDPDPDTNNDGIFVENYDRAREYYDGDLKLLRDTETGLGPYDQPGIGQINIIIVQPTYYESAQKALVPPGRLFPEEVIQVYENYERNGCNEEIFKDITNRYIRDKFGCIGVAIDDSGSTQRYEIFPGLDYWFYNITDKSSNRGNSSGYTPCLYGGINEDTPIYVDPLADCADGSINLNDANGCVQVEIFRGESWLKEAANVARSLFQRGCTKKSGEENE